MRLFINQQNYWLSQPRRDGLLCWKLVLEEIGFFCVFWDFLPDRENISPLRTDRKIPPIVEASFELVKLLAS